MPPSQNSSSEKVVVPPQDMSQQKGSTQRDEVGRSPRELRENGHSLPPTDSTIDFCRESERLKTFDRWPVEFLAPRRLTSAGFYYTRKGDDVRCAFCGIVVGRWVRGDDPMADHERWSPGCPFIRNMPVRNVPLDSTEPPVTTATPNGYDVCGTFTPEEMNSVGTDARDPAKPISLLEKSTGYQKTRAVSFPNYASLDSRVLSFRTWPVSLKVKPDVLSDAGFFYTGKGDQTLCFHCGGGLKDWEENDEPWVEHARWFSKCPFVLCVKGKEFIDEVNGARARQDIEGSPLGLSSSTGELEKLPSSSAQLDNFTEVEHEVKPEVKEKNEPESQSNDRLCKICYCEEVGLVFVPCGHIVACVKCGISLLNCAICRKRVEGTFRAYFS